jgi:hypothetical protein
MRILARPWAIGGRDRDSIWSSRSSARATDAMLSANWLTYRWTFVSGSESRTRTSYGRMPFVPALRIRVKLRLVPQGAGFLSFEAGQDQCVFVFD